MMIKVASFLLVSGAALGLLDIGSVANAQNDQAQASSAGGQCRVSIDRSREAGVFDVVRQELSDENCVCIVSTGPASQGANIENQIASLVQNRRCPGARVVQLPEQAAAGGMSNTMVGLLGAAGAAGIIVGLGNSEANNDISVSP